MRTPRSQSHARDTRVYQRINGNSLSLTRRGEHYNPSPGNIPETYTIRHPETWSHSGGGQDVSQNWQRGRQRSSLKSDLHSLGTETQATNASNGEGNMASDMENTTVHGRSPREYPRAKRELSSSDGSTKIQSHDTSLVVEQFRAFRKHRSAVSYCILRSCDERQYIRQQQKLLLQQHFQFLMTDPVILADGRILDMRDVVDQALKRLDVLQESLDPVDVRLVEADSSLVAAERQLKDYITPDDASDCLEIPDGAIQDMMSWSDSDSRISVEAEIDLTQLQLDLLQEALFSNIADPIGLVDIDAFLAYRATSSPASSVSGDKDPSDQENEQEQLRFREAFDMELEIRSSGIQFVSRPYQSAETFSSIDLTASSAQAQKRHQDLETRDDSTSFYAFWEVCRTSWLEFSRLLWQLANDFGFVKKFDLLDIDRLLANVQKTARYTEGSTKGVMATLSVPHSKPSGSILVRLSNKPRVTSLQTLSGRTIQHLSYHRYQASKDAFNARSHYLSIKSRRSKAASVPTRPPTTLTDEPRSIRDSSLDLSRSSSRSGEATNHMRGRPFLHSPRNSYNGSAVDHRANEIGLSQEAVATDRYPFRPQGHSRQLSRRNSEPSRAHNGGWHSSPEA